MLKVEIILGYLNFFSYICIIILRYIFKEITMATIKNNEEIIQLLDTAKYLLRGHKQNLNVQWAIDKINKAIKALK